MNKKIKIAIIGIIVVIVLIYSFTLHGTHTFFTYETDMYKSSKSSTIAVSMAEGEI